jgi:4-hydroxyacetophenone monooxygenase
VENYSAIVVGGGFSGIVASAKLSDMGLDHVVLESGTRLGGTWQHNEYPGCAADAFGQVYSISFFLYAW